MRDEQLAGVYRIYKPGEKIHVQGRSASYTFTVNAEILANGQRTGWLWIDIAPVPESIYIEAYAILGMGSNRREYRTHDGHIYWKDY